MAAEILIIPSSCHFVISISERFSIPNHKMATTFSDLLIPKIKIKWKRAQTSSKNARKIFTARHWIWLQVTVTDEAKLEYNIFIILSVRMWLNKHQREM